MMTKVTINLNKVIAASKEAFRDSCYLLGRSFTEVISDSNAFPQHPGRDLVDEGILRGSQTPPQFKTDSEAIFYWLVAYAYYQHEGYTLRNGEIWEGRPWTKEGIQRLNLLLTYARLLEAKL